MTTSVPQLNIQPKASDFHRKELLRMYKELTDDDVIADNKRRFERQRRIEDRKADTGAWEKPKHRLAY